jgi:hypothetical protein
MRLLRFPDLIARGLFNSRMTLKRAIDTQGFPPGALITPNARVWSEDGQRMGCEPSCRQKGHPPKGRPECRGACGRRVKHDLYSKKAASRAWGRPS